MSAAQELGALTSFVMSTHGTRGSFCHCLTKPCTQEGIRERGQQSPVLAKDEGVEGEQGKKDRVFVLCERGGRDQHGGSAANSDQRTRLRGQPAAQHHQIPCKVQPCQSVSQSVSHLLRFQPLRLIRCLATFAWPAASTPTKRLW